MSVPTMGFMGVKSLQLCLTLSDPMDCSPPGSSVHGILWARILEAIPLLGIHTEETRRERDTREGAFLKKVVAAEMRHTNTGIGSSKCIRRAQNKC